MNREEILSHVDHTLLKPEATWPQIQQLCDEAIANHTASVCINTCYVKQAVEYMAGRIPVCCVVGFPLGAMDTASKAFEAKTAIENGAAEVDMVINIGRLKNKEYDAVREDIRAVKQAVGDRQCSQNTENLLRLKSFHSLNFPLNQSWKCTHSNCPRILQKNNSALTG